MNSQVDSIPGSGKAQSEIEARLAGAGAAPAGPSDPPPAAGGRGFPGRRPAPDWASRLRPHRPMIPVSEALGADPQHPGVFDLLREPAERLAAEERAVLLVPGRHD